MLSDFLISNRSELAARCKNKMARRLDPSEPLAAVDEAVPLFLQKLAEVLFLEQVNRNRIVAELEPAVTRSKVDDTAASHGAELLRAGYSVGHVVHVYGDVCQAVTELAVERKTFISTEEFHTLNGCLDNAIADAVTAYCYDSLISINDQRDVLDKHLDSFSVEQRRLADLAIEAFSKIRAGKLEASGETGTALLDALLALRGLVDRTLPEIRLEDATTTLARR